MRKLKYLCNNTFRLKDIVNHVMFVQSDDASTHGGNGIATGFSESLEPFHSAELKGVRRGETYIGNVSMAERDQMIDDFPHGCAVFDERVQSEACLILHVDSGDGNAEIAQAVYTHLADIEGGHDNSIRIFSCREVVEKLFLICCIAYPVKRKVVSIPMQYRIQTRDDLRKKPGGWASG